MDYTIKISKIRKSKIDNLIDSINIVKPNVVPNTIQLSNRWKNASKVKREAIISNFIMSNSFSEKELTSIYKLTTKLVIPWKKVFYLLISILILFISVKSYLYYKLDRIYYIGASEKLNTTPNGNLTVNPILEKENIFYGTITTSKKSFIKLESFDDFYYIQEDNFIKWILGNFNKIKVDTIDFVQSKYTFEKYIKIFKPIIYLEEIKILNSYDRKAIYNYIEKNPNIISISNDINDYKNNFNNSSYTAIAKGQNGPTYLYLRFNDIKNQNKNYVLQYNNILYPNAGLIKTSGSFSYDNFIFFKKQSGMYPDVYDVYDYISKKNFEITVNNQDPDFLKPL